MSNGNNKRPLAMMYVLMWSSVVICFFLTSEASIVLPIALALGYMFFTLYNHVFDWELRGIVIRTGLFILITGAGWFIEVLLALHDQKDVVGATGLLFSLIYLAIINSTEDEKKVLTIVEKILVFIEEHNGLAMLIAWGVLAVPFSLMNIIYNKGQEGLGFGLVTGLMLYASHRSLIRNVSVVWLILAYLCSAVMFFICRTMMDPIYVALLTAFPMLLFLFIIEEGVGFIARLMYSDDNRKPKRKNDEEYE